MNRNIIGLIKKLRATYISITKTNCHFADIYHPISNISKEETALALNNVILEKKPRMVARLGNIELLCLCTYHYHIIEASNSFPKKVLQYITCKRPPFWFDDSIETMSNNTGFFPATINNFAKFYDLMLKDMEQVDYFGSWSGMEAMFKERLKNSISIRLPDIEPYYHSEPWTQALEGKTVLIIHPFADSITLQYSKRELLFSDPRILPKFDLIVLRAVQSIGNQKVPFNDWFEALDYMKSKIDKIDFDVAIIGCGAYGFPLAAHIKRLGRVAIIMGGATQILFGIKGKRWEKEPFFISLMNEHWIKPLPHETPEISNKIEDGCYW